MSEQRLMSTGVRPVVLAAGDDAVVHVRTVDDDPAVEPYVSLAIAPAQDPGEVLGALCLTPEHAARLVQVLARHLAAEHPEHLRRHVAGFVVVRRLHDGVVEMADDTDPGAVMPRAADALELAAIEDGDPVRPARVAGYLPVALVPVTRR